MSDKKIEAFFDLIHQENKSIMLALLKMGVKPSKVDEITEKTFNAWDGAFEKIMKAE